jgi:polysaccharide biosynthesis transport protein
MGNYRPRSAVEYFTILQRRKWLVLLYTAGVAFAGLTLTNAIPSVYESQSVLAISERAGKDPEARSSRISTATERVISKTNLEALISRYPLKSVTESVDGAVQRLREKIKIQTKVSDSSPPVPVALYVSYRLTDPSLAQQVVTDVVATLNGTNDVLTKRAALEADWVNSQIVQLEKQLTNRSKWGAGTSLSMGFGGDPEAIRIALLSTIDSLNDKQYALEQQINEQERQIREQRRISATSPKDSPYGALLLRKTELAAQLREYAPQYTDKNPKVLQAKTQLSEVDRQLAALGEKNPLGSAGYETLILERELVRLQTELELARREIGRKKTAWDTLSRTYGYSSANGSRNPDRSRTEVGAGYDRVGTRYQSLLEQRDQIQRAGISAAWEPPLFDVIDPPNLPQLPVGPNRQKLAAFALGLGLGAGLLILVIAEGRRLFRIQDHNDVAYFLGMPVLTVIPETLSPVERGLKWRKMIASKFSVVLLAAALPAMALAMRHHNFFQSVVSR